jgi:hypothetical protein
MDEAELLKRYNSVYLEIIMKYRDKIEDGESISAAELPRLIVPDDVGVVALAKKMTDEIEGYSYDRDFYRVAESAFDYINVNIETVALPIQFWLAPGQTLNCRCGDIFDKATLLCSVLIAMGNYSSRVIVSTYGEIRILAVYFVLDGRISVMDLEDKNIISFADRDTFLKEFVHVGETDAEAYEFGDSVYASLA